MQGSQHVNDGRERPKPLQSGNIQVSSASKPRRPQTGTTEIVVLLSYLQAVLCSGCAALCFLPCIPVISRDRQKQAVLVYSKRVCCKQDVVYLAMSGWGGSPSW